jgi:hypothetical protein
MVGFIMDQKQFSKVIDALEGLNWFFISGTAVSTLTCGERKPGDLDMAVFEIDEFAKRLGTKVQHRFFDKGTFFVDDYGFVVIYEGVEVEATSGFPKKRMDENKFKKLFDLKQKRELFERQVYVEPVEETICNKGFMFREKDKNKKKTFYTKF